MKKILALILALTAVFAAQTAFADEPVGSGDPANMVVYVDNELTNVRGSISGGNVVLPLKQMCAILGYELAEEGERVLLTPGKDCKNSRGAVVRSEIISGSIVSYGEDGTPCPIKTTAEYGPVTERDGELYIMPYYLARMLDLKLQKRLYPNETGFLTRDYLAGHAEEYRGTILVHLRNIYITVDDRRLEFSSPPFIDEAGRVQVPARDFCEQLGWTVDWFDDPGRVAIVGYTRGESGSAGGASYWFTIGEKKCRRNGDYFDIDTAAQLVDGKAYIPLRYLAEMMDYYIDFNPASAASATHGE